MTTYEALCEGVSDTLSASTCVDFKRNERHSLCFELYLLFCPLPKCRDRCALRSGGLWGVQKLRVAGSGLTLLFESWARSWLVGVAPRPIAAYRGVKFPRSC